ncbi:MAG: DUF1638 domain-containing protein [Geminicoccaceae bacterium]
MVAFVEPVVVIACGALAREILAIKAINGLEHVELRCLPASLHNRPEQIPARVEAAIVKARRTTSRILVAYGDCGTGGELDRVLTRQGVERIAGPHCYSFFSGNDQFARQSEEEFTAFYLTDFLTRQFRTLVVKPLGLDRHPELRDLYFGHYEKVVYLVQVPDPGLMKAAERAARTLGLPLEIRHTGYGELATFLTHASAVPEVLTW